MGGRAYRCLSVRMRIYWKSGTDLRGSLLHIVPQTKLKKNRHKGYIYLPSPHIVYIRVHICDISHSSHYAPSIPQQGIDQSLNKKIPDGYHRCRLGIQFGSGMLCRGTNILCSFGIGGLGSNRTGTLCCRCSAGSSDRTGKLGNNLWPGIPGMGIYILYTHYPQHT